VKLLDFGLAKAFDPVASASGNATINMELNFFDEVRRQVATSEHLDAAHRWRQATANPPIESDSSAWHG